MEGDTSGCRLHGRNGGLMGKAGGSNHKTDYRLGPVIYLLRVLKQLNSHLSFPSVSKVYYNTSLLFLMVVRIKCSERLQGTMKCHVH